MYSEIDAILDDLRTAVRRDVHRRRWRTVTAAAMCTLVLCFAGVGIAGSYEDWWSGAQPPANPDQVQQAINENTHGLIQPLSSEKATVATTADASLVAVGTKGGGYCLIPSLTSVPNIGNSCVSSPQSLLYTYATPAGAEQQWILYGRVVDADAASIDLSALGVPQPVRLERGGFFLVDLPQSSWSALDDAHGPITIRDAHGNVVTTGCAALGPKPGEPGSGSHNGELGGPGESCDDSTPVRPRPDASQAQRLGTITLTEDYGPDYPAGTQIAEWTSPGANGSTCYFVGPAGDPGTAQAPAFCPGPANWKPDRPWLDENEGPTGAHVAMGALAADTVITRIAVEGPDGYAQDVPIVGRGFLVQVPDTGGPYKLVYYDASGNVVYSYAA